MPEEVKLPRLLVWVTIVVLIIISGIMVYLSEIQPTTSITLNISGQPTIGSSEAKVHVVAFEEPKCINCKGYNKKVFPKIKKEFIDTNKITYTVIPVSFLPRSMPAAVALMCVYHTDFHQPNSEFFFTYLHYLYDHQPDEQVNWATTEKLVYFAKEALPEIQTDKLEKCITQGTYRSSIEQNTAYGRKVMGGIIATPSLFVDGIEAKSLSYEEISNMIVEALEKRGVQR